MKNAYALSV